MTRNYFTNNDKGHGKCRKVPGNCYLQTPDNNCMVKLPCPYKQMGEPNND